MRIVVALVAGYLLGSIPVAVLVGRAVAGVDVRRSGDGNMGYWNAKEQLGARTAVPVFVGDTLKGVAAGAVWLLVGGPWWIGYLGVGAAMIGHAYPVFAGFRGGRSVLTFAGGLAVLSPPTFVLGVTACVVVSLLTRSFATGARVGVFSVPVIQLLVQREWPPYRVAATGTLMTIIGLRFLVASRTARATSGPDAAPPA